MVIFVIDLFTRLNSIIINNDAACSRNGEYPQNICFLQYDTQNVEHLLISCRILF